MNTLAHKDTKDSDAVPFSLFIEPCKYVCTTKNQNNIFISISFKKGHGLIINMIYNNSNHKIMKAFKRVCTMHSNTTPMMNYGHVLANQRQIN